MDKATGKVYLVGAGPGDPGLLTLRGKEVLEHADVVVYDNLVNEALLRHAAKAEIIHVGKRTDQHTLPQEDINRILLERASRGQNVVRLKGGDPLVFGRGGEEAQFLAEHGISFEIVPGVTAGIAAPAYAGIPLTHRGISSSLTLISGHQNPSKGDTGVDFEKLHLQGTLAIYMGLGNMEAINARLIRSGRSPETPAAAIRWGTLSKQRVITGTLADLHERCRQAELTSPVLLVIGEAVELRDTIAWFEDRPLHGRRIAVTHTRKRNSELAGLLREKGADVLEFPTVVIEAPPDPPDLKGLSNYDWVVLTSINAVDMLFEGLEKQGLDARNLHSALLCAIGAKTVEALHARSLRPDIAPGNYETASVVAAMHDKSAGLTAKRILIPRADIARSSLIEALRANNAHITELHAYETALPPGAEALAENLLDFAPHYITFTSAAAARNFKKVVGPEGLSALAANAVYAAIGPVAQRAAHDQGINVQIVPEIHRAAHLAEALVQWDASPENNPPGSEQSA